VNKIQVGPDLCLKERKQYEDLLHKYIYLFTLSYEDLKEITMEQHKIKLLPNAKPVGTKQGRWNLRYIPTMKEDFNKLLEAKFIKLVETIKWIFLMIFALKKMAN